MLETRSCAYHVVASTSRSVSHCEQEIRPRTWSGIRVVRPSTPWGTCGAQGTHRCLLGATSSHNHCQHHLYWQESRTSASYLLHAPLAGAWEEMHDALPFSLERQSSHPAALEQESMILNEDGPGSEESGNGNETAHNKKTGGLHDQSNL